MRFGKRSGAIAAVVTGATLVPLVAFGGVGLAAKNAPSGSEYQYPGANQYKVRICHYTHSKKHPWVIITISKSAWPAHQRVVPEPGDRRAFRSCHRRLAEAFGCHQRCGPVSLRATKPPG